MCCFHRDVLRSLCDVVCLHIYVVRFFDYVVKFFHYVAITRRDVDSLLWRVVHSLR